ncbi:MAG: sensor histidine kinase [Clostridiales bacterium]|jgi:two-component system sensor histidine kinase YesM|nr:sensor histidine kinase [Clostridiales bacterium]
MSLKLKIILSSAFCVLVVGLFGNVILYRYLEGIITEKAANIDGLNLQSVQTRINSVLEELTMLGASCTYDQDIARGMRNTEILTVPQKRNVLAAQKSLQGFLDTRMAIEPYIIKMMVVNSHGVMAGAVSREFNGIWDAERMLASDVFLQFTEAGLNQMISVAPSIVDGDDCVVFLSNIYEMPAAAKRGWLYIEMSPDFISDIVAPYTPGSIFVAGSDGNVFPAVTSLPAKFPLGQLLDGEVVSSDGRVYKMQSKPLAYAGLALYSKTDITSHSADTKAILNTTVMVVLTSLLTAMLFAVLLGSLITKPIKRLTERLRRISAKDFSFDPSIEKGDGEIADMGRVINEMAVSINKLLKETEEMHVQRRNAEIALLQSQVNPHFLYNTLDSIRWMAVIQKNPGIEKTVQSLSNLLKNLSKGTGDKITLEEELSLLRDYIDTQSVRFMALLEFEDRIPKELRGYGIVKFTLQPLVENAIFHGIEPSGEFGKITLDAKEDGGYLMIIVEDNGVGMGEEDLRLIAQSCQKPHPKGMASMGLYNVDSRLKLVYGEECGLLYESEPGAFTRVTVRIKKEGPDVPGIIG